MRAGVPGRDRPSARAGYLRGQRRVSHHRAHGAHRLVTVTDGQVAIGGKKPFGIVPGRADQRNAAGQRLEHADGRNAWESLDVRAPRHMHREAPAGECIWNAVVGKPPGAYEALLARTLDDVVRITHTVQPPGEFRLRQGFDQELPQLPVPLAIAPVPDPDQVGFFGRRRRAKQGDIRGLVPGDHPATPAAAAVDLS